jgi:uncharacterized protein
MKQITRLMLVWVILTALPALSACGPTSPTFDIVLKEFSFAPDTISVPAEAQVTLNLKNEGMLEHDFVIMALGKEATLPFNEDDQPNVYWQVEVQPRESATVVFTAPSEPGEYEMICAIAGHLEQGMKGKLVVVK